MPTAILKFQTGQPFTPRAAAAFTLSGTVNISGKSNVTATGDYGIYTTSGIHVQNSSVTAEGADGNSICAPYGNVAIEDSTVEARGRIRDSGEFASPNKGIVISNSSVTVTGGQQDLESTYSNITISGDAADRVIVQGTRYGIYTYNGSIIISGGEIIARGNPVFYWENSEKAGLGCTFTVVPPAGKLCHVETGSGESLTEIAGSPFTAETALDSSLFQSDTAFHCYLADDPTHQHTYDQWKYDETNHWHACACGASADDAAPHVYDSAADLTCDVCGYERTIAAYAVSVSASPTEGGSVTGSGSYTPGTLVQLTATANSGYHFVEWNVLSGKITISSNAFTMPGSQVTVDAVFVKSPETLPFTDAGESYWAYDKIVWAWESSDAVPLAGLNGKTPNESAPGVLSDAGGFFQDAAGEADAEGPKRAGPDSLDHCRLGRMEGRFLKALKRGSKLAIAAACGGCVNAFPPCQSAIPAPLRMLLDVVDLPLTVLFPVHFPKGFNPIAPGYHLTVLVQALMCVVDPDQPLARVKMR